MSRRIQVIYEDILDGERRCAFLSSCLSKTNESVWVYQKVVIEKRKKPCYRNDNGAFFLTDEVRSGRVLGFRCVRQWTPSGAQCQDGITQSSQSLSSFPYSSH